MKIITIQSMRRFYTQLLCFFLCGVCLLSFVVSATAATTSGYTIELLPLSIHPSDVEGKTWINGSFKLFNTGMPSRDLEPENLIVLEDTAEQSDYLEIIAPDGNKERAVDFVFVLDITGSMRSSIAAVKNNILQFADKLSDKTNGVIDYRLALITFRDDVIVENDEKFNPSGGKWTKDAAEFKSWANAITLGNGNDLPEAAFDALGRASELTTREGAQRIIILFTDAPSHIKGDSNKDSDPKGVTFLYTQQEIINKLKTNGFICYVAGPEHKHYKDKGSTSYETGGRWYDIRSSVVSILDDIRIDVKNQYTFRYLSSARAGWHNVEIGIALPDYALYRSNMQRFLIGAAPVLTLCEASQKLISEGWHHENTPIDICIKAEDMAEPYVTSVSLFYRHVEADAAPSYTSIEMLETDTAGIYTAQIPSLSVLSPAVEFYAVASDGERSGSTPPTNASATPWRIQIINHPPVIEGLCDTTTYPVGKNIPLNLTITDPDGDAINSVTLCFRNFGTLDTFECSAMESSSASSFMGNIPARLATSAGIEIEIEAIDNRGAKNEPSYCKLLPETVPVMIKSVNKLYDTSDTIGPYGVRAVVVSADTVTLHYTVNGAAEKTMNMPPAVTELADREDRSNIYYADMPGQPANSTVMYWVTASNLTGQTDSFPLEPYTFKVRPAPEEMKLLNDTIILTPGEIIELTAAGCFGPPYKWTTTAGSLSTDTGSKTILTAGELPGIYPVQAADPNGICTVTLPVKIVTPLTLLPESLVNLNPMEEYEFTAEGGEPPYTFTLSDGPATLDGSTVLASSTSSGIVTLTVKDAKNRTASTDIRINGALSLSIPSEVTYSPGAIEMVSVTGGTPPYLWEIIGGNSEATETDSSIQYTVPIFSGIYYITVADMYGNTDTSRIIVGLPLLVTPTLRVIQSGETAEFSVSGGIGPYRWVASQGDITGSATALYSPPPAAGVYSLTLTDATGYMKDVSVMVISGLHVMPSELELSIGQSATLTVQGGSGTYRVSATYGTTVVDQSTIRYTAPDRAVTDIITIEDLVTLKKIEVNAEVTVSIFSVMPSSLFVKINGNATLTIIGGSGSFKVETDKGTADLKGKQVIYSAPAMVGTDQIRIIDTVNGKKLTIMVTIISDAVFAITPEQITLTPGEKGNFSAANAKGTVVWTATSGTVSNGAYTAPTNTGVFTVTATDTENGETDSATVYVRADLTLTPSNATISTKDSVSFSVKGGKEPYVWAVVGEGVLDVYEGSTVSYSPTKRTGMSKVMVIDNAGASTEAQIQVIGSMMITPSEVSLVPKSTQQFSVAGGTGTYKWSATQGNISTTGLYTAPDLFGTYTITVTDDSGNEGSATVSVGNYPVITPAYAWLNRKGEVDFKVVGGVAPFYWIVSAGDYTQTDNAIRYKAPDASTDVTVEVTDSRGQKSRATVYVDLPLLPSKEIIYIEPGQSTQVAVTGGFPPFEWKASQGDLKDVVTEYAGFNIYTAPKVMGQNQIVVRDQTNRTATIEVHVTQPLRVTPNTRYMKRMEEKSFTIVSGVPPYSGRIVSGDGDIEPQESNDGIFKFTSGNTANSDVEIEFMDNSGQIAIVHAYVETSIKVSPMNMYAERNETYSFKVSGGTGDYFAQADWGTVDVDPETGVGSYLSPGRYDDYTITIYDSSDQSVDINVKVEKTTPVISPSVGVFMIPGETKSFLVNRGVKPYDWSFEGNTPIVNKKDDSIVEITAPQASGVYKLIVTDVNGNTAETPVTVSHPLEVSPAIYTLYKGEDAIVKVKAVGGFPPYRWITTNLEVVYEATDYISVRTPLAADISGEFSVICKDSMNAVTQMSIVITSIPGDINSNDQLEENEIQYVIDNFFIGNQLNGLQLNDFIVSRLIDIFLSKQNK
ncbi:MAG: VWA domain-containing protein [Desulfobacterales bacterium]|nr:VWA domain-containing protein [Desulfobacterales bacterium]